MDLAWIWHGLPLSGAKCITLFLFLKERHFCCIMIDGNGSGMDDPGKPKVELEAKIHEQYLRAEKARSEILLMSG
jgi:hypothetical protein